ncbi:MAG: sulfur oxidation c-type cytochrome SoxX [Pseudomonadota bacterium]
MNQKTTLAAAIAATALFTLSHGTTALATDKAAAKVDYTKMKPEALAEYLVFESGSFDLEQPTQEGTNGRARLTQDELMQLCTKAARSKKGLDAKTADKIRAMAQATIKYPEGGIKLGDWKKGRDLAWSGFGFRTAHNPDKHGPNNPPGANCYNCHQLATDRTGGDLGPSLTGFGKLRGNSPEMLKYAYDVIYNPHVYFACTYMPRLGANGVLTPEQIADVMAYLFDPESPVNK